MGEEFPGTRMGASITQHRSYADMSLKERKKSLLGHVPTSCGVDASSAKSYRRTSLLANRKGKTLVPRTPSESSA